MASRGERRPTRSAAWSARLGRVTDGTALPEREPDPPARRAAPAWILPAVVLAAAALAYLLVPPVRELADRSYAVVAGGDRAELEALVRRLGPWGPAMMLGLLLLQTVVTVIPAALTVLVSVLVFGPVGGAAIAWVGLVLASLLGYWMGWALGPVTVERLVGRATMARVRRVVGRYGGWAVLAARVSLTIPSDALSIVAGVARAPLGPFVLATAVGVIPGIALVAVVGSDLRRLWPVLLGASAASLLGFAGLVARDRSRRGRRAPEADAQNA